MPLLVGGRRPGAAPETQLQRLADLWVEATTVGADLRALEAKVAAQSAWLDAHRDHPKYVERMHRAWEVRQEAERAMRRVHDVAKDANKLVAEMDPATRRRAQEEIHAWAAIGSPGIYAVAWDLVPDAAWLEEQA